MRIQFLEHILRSACFQGHDKITNLRLMNTRAQMKNYNPFIKCPPKITSSIQSSLVDSDQENSEINTKSQIEGIISKIIDIGNYSKFSIEQQSTLLQLQNAELRLSSLTTEKMDNSVLTKTHEAQQFILHNLSCSYRRRQELNLCTGALQRLIENLNEQARASQSSKSTKRAKSRLSDNVNRATLLVRIGNYYIQFCQANPQGTHSERVALHAITLLKNAFKQIYWNISQNESIASSQTESKFKSNILQRCSNIVHPQNTPDKPLMIRAAKHYLSKNMSVIRRSALDDFMCQLSILFQDYSIQNITQSQALTFDQFQCRYMENYSSRGLIEKVVMLAVAYHTLATQTRSKAMREGPNLPKGKEISEIYHLMAIVTFAANIPFPFLCLKNLLKTYKAHYGDSLEEPELNFTLRSSETEFDSIIFPGFSSKLLFRDRQTTKADSCLQIASANQKNYQLQAYMNPYMNSQASPALLSPNRNSHELSQLSSPHQKKDLPMKFTANTVEDSKEIQVQYFLQQKEVEAIPKNKIPLRSKSPKISTSSTNKIRKIQNRLRRKSEFNQLCRPFQKTKKRESSFSISSKRLKSQTPFDGKFKSLPRISSKTKLGLKREVATIKKAKSNQCQYFTVKLKKLENPQKKMEEGRVKQRDSFSKLKSLMHRLRTQSPHSRNANSKEKMQRERLLMAPSQSYFGKEELRKPVKAYRKGKLVSEYCT